MTDTEVGRKDDGGKPRIDLVDSSLLPAVGSILAFGASKYGDRNWEKGIAYGRVFAAMQRHLWAWWSGQDLDEESGLSHLAHGLCNLMFLIAFSKRPVEFRKQFDDRPWSRNATV
jgi:hypothetical protein